MLKYLIYFLVIVSLVSLLIGGIHLYRVAQRNKKEMARYEGEAVTLTANLGKTLVVFYSLSGNTKDIAQRIQSKTGADLYEIATAESIEVSPILYLKLRQQLKNKIYPALSGKMPDFSQYDTIFVGFPVWWYTIATPVLAFLQKADFQGKRVVPFSTQGSNVGTSFDDFAAKAKHAVLLESASFNNLPEKYNQAVDNKITTWLNSLPN